MCLFIYLFTNTLPQNYFLFSICNELTDSRPRKPNLKINFKAFNIYTETFVALCNYLSTEE